MQVKTFRILLVDELREIYYSEALVQEAFRRLSRGADNADLRSFFEAQQARSSGHLQQLEKAFGLLHENPRGGRALAMKALLQEIEDRMGESGQRYVLDAGLVLGAQRLSQWKVTSYAGVAEWAALQRESEVATLLREVLDDQQAIAGDVARLAEDINVKAKVSG